MTCTFESCRWSSWGSTACEMLSLSSLHAIAEEFVKKFHLEGRTVTPVTVRASSGTCFVSLAAAGKGLTERVSLCSCPGLVLKHNLLCWMRNEVRSGRWSKPRSKGSMFGCQVLFCFHIFKIFCNSLIATWMSFYNNIPKLFSGTAKFLSGLCPYAL